jgi:hypothetical protein
LELTSGFSGPRTTAIIIDGAQNIARGNLARGPEGAVWGVGIRFLKDGNFYGNNQMSALVPFDLGGTVQTDWGSNFGF